MLTHQRISQRRAPSTLKKMERSMAATPYWSKLTRRMSERWQPLLKRLFPRSLPLTSKSLAGVTRRQRSKFTSTQTNSGAKSRKTWSMSNLKSTSVMSKLRMKKVTFMCEISTSKSTKDLPIFQHAYDTISLFIRLSEKIEPENCSVRVRPNRITIILKKWLETAWSDLTRAAPQKKKWTTTCY